MIDPLTRYIDHLFTYLALRRVHVSMSKDHYLKARDAHQELILVYQTDENQDRLIGVLTLYNDLVGKVEERKLTVAQLGSLLEQMDYAQVVHYIQTGE